MSLTENQKKHLRRLAHSLHPLVTAGSSVGEPGKLAAISKELDSTLNAHELVKISARLGDRAARDQVFAELCKQTGAELVQRIGNVAVLYRAHPDKPKVILPDA